MARKERERRYIAEYMRETFPGGDFQLNVELGPIPKDYVVRMGYARAAAMFRPTRPRIDAVHWSPEEYILIEAKIRDLKAGIGDLTYYRNIIPETRDLPFYDGQPIISRLVIPWTLEWLEPVARANNIEIVVFTQEWIADYVKERQNYFTAEYRNERQEKMRLREVLGVD